MVSVHMIVGSATLLLFLLNTILYGIEMSRGEAISFHRLVSVSAATGLLLQYMLGFLLLGQGHSISVWHWIIALVTIAAVGMEHGMTANLTDFKQKSRMGMIASLLATVLVLAAYGIAEMG